MNKFFTLLALTASVAIAQEKCSKISCNSPQVSVSPNNDKYCECQCGYTTGALTCPAGEEPSSADCGCVTSDPCAGQTCDDKAEPTRWMMDETCSCVPAEGEDPCDAMYEGAFTMADGTDCPAGEGMEGEAGAVAQTASLALAFAAAMLF